MPTSKNGHPYDLDLMVATCRYWMNKRARRGQYNTGLGYSGIHISCGKLVTCSNLYVGKDCPIFKELDTSCFRVELDSLPPHKIRSWLKVHFKAAWEMAVKGGSK